MKEGDRHVASELLPLVYDELRKLAQHRMSSEKPGHTLQATGLSMKLIVVWWVMRN